MAGEDLNKVCISLSYWKICFGRLYFKQNVKNFRIQKKFKYGSIDGISDFYVSLNAKTDAVEFEIVSFVSRVPPK